MCACSLVVFGRGGGGVLHKQSEPVICVSGVGAFLVRQCDLHSPEIIRGLPV